jgi:hypothetical protein
MGWYPDPTNPGIQRYWDGSAWTEHWAPRAGPTKAGPAGQPRDSPSQLSVSALLVGLLAAPAAYLGLGNAMTALGAPLWLSATIVLGIIPVAALAFTVYALRQARAARRLPVVPAVGVVFATIWALPSVVLWVWLLISGWQQ